MKTSPISTFFHTAQQLFKRAFDLFQDGIIFAPTSALYATCIAVCFVLLQNTALSPDAYEGIVSSASIVGVDIATRTSLWFLALALFIMSFIVLTIGAGGIAKRSTQTLSSWLNGSTGYALAATFVFFIANPIIQALPVVLLLLVVVHVMIWIDYGVISLHSKNKKQIEIHFSLERVLYGVLAGWGGAFVYALLLNQAVLGMQHMIVFILCSAVYAVIDAWLSLGKKNDAWTVYIHRIVSIGAALPLFFFIAIEWYFFAAEKGLYSPKPVIVVFCLIGIAVVKMTLLSIWGHIAQKKKKAFDFFYYIDTHTTTLLLVVAIISCGFLTLYEPTLPVNIDLFEPANPGLMIQQYREFGKIPWLQNFNAHGFSDALFGFLYTAIHGASELNWQFFDFMPRIIEIVLGYAALAWLLRSRWSAAWFVLFFPFTNVLFPQYATMMLFGVFALAYAITRPSWKSWATAVVAVLACVLWRIDAGAALAVAAVVLSFGFLVYHGVQKHWKHVFVPIAVTSSIAIVAIAALLGSLFVLGIHPAQWIQDLLAILNSDQTFGYPGILRESTPISVFLMQLVVLPVVATVVVTVAWVKYRKLFSPAQWVVLSALLIMSFFLTTRGLVRHTFIEGITEYYTQFGLFILVVVSIRFLSLYGRMQGAWATLCAYIGATIFVFMWGLPTPSIGQAGTSAIAFSSFAESAWERFDRVVDPFYTIQTPANIPIRSITSDAWKSDAYGVMNAFVSENLTESQTFFDFSNAPMLYYFLNKELPIYANHQMIMHDAYLQQRTIGQIKEYDVPVVVYRAVAPNTYVLDGVSPHDRYALLDEYIQSTYHPYAVMNGREVWIRNDWTPTHALPKGVESISQSESTPTHNIGSIPLLEGENDALHASLISSIVYQHVLLPAEQEQFTNTGTTSPIVLGPGLQSGRTQEMDIVLRASIAPSAQYKPQPLWKKVLQTNQVLNNKAVLVLGEVGSQAPKTEIAFSVWSQGVPASANTRDVEYRFRVSPYPEWRAMQNPWMMLSVPQGIMTLHSITVEAIESR